MISQLSDLGIVETGEEGRGFALLDMDSEGLGVPSLMSAFSGFTGRWSWGVRTLVQDGNQFAQRLGLAAGVVRAVALPEARCSSERLGPCPAVPPGS